MRERPVIGYRARPDGGRAEDGHENHESDRGRRFFQGYLDRDAVMIPEGGKPSTSPR